MNAAQAVNLAIWSTAVTCAVMGGIYFTFSSFVMDSLESLPAHQGVASMQSINRVILSSSFMPLFFGSTIVALALGILGVVDRGSPGALALIVGALVYVLGMFACTAAFNVPLNEALDAVDPTTGSAAQTWAHYLSAWTRYNDVRTVASVLASALFVFAGVARL